MGCIKYSLYMIWGEGEYVIDISPRPEVDLGYYRLVRGYDQGVVLTQPLPVGVADELLDKVTTADERRGMGFTEGPGEGKGFWRSLVGKLAGITPDPVAGDKVIAGVINEKLRKIAKFLDSRGLPSQKPARIFQVEPVEEKDFRLLMKVRNLLEGRILYPHEVEEVLRGQECFELGALTVMLQLMYLKGWCRILPSVGFAKGKPKCLRCGEREKVVPINCLDCGWTGCVACEECLMMGEARSCLPLYAFPGCEPVSRPVLTKAVLDFPLTPAQRDAARQVVEFIRNDGREQALVWAVTGAGKTEVAFGAIAETLGRGGRVLFAIPRRDVVLELEPRLKKAFPETVIRVLYGGSKEKFLSGQLIIATTHQVIRFYENFDLVILDEVDAFPYQGSAMLHLAVKRARKPGGKMVLMTATPDLELLKRVKTGEAAQVNIPARHHGYPLPVPELLQIPSVQKGKRGKEKAARPVLEFLHRSIEGEGARVFVFVPTIALAERTARVLNENLFAGRVENEPEKELELVRYSHSKDPLRDEKRESFANGDFPVLVTTSIMERGVTIPRCNVLVLFGEKEHIYDAGTLVQMAGRAGRTTGAPTGRVLFVGSKITEAMTEARRQIGYMNELARKKGYLRC